MNRHVRFYVGLFGILLAASAVAQVNCGNANVDAKQFFQLLLARQTTVKDVEAFFEAHSVPIDARDSQCRNLLFYAVGRFDIFHFLYEQYGQPNPNRVVRDNNEKPANSLYAYALQNGSFETISFLRSVGGDLANAIDDGLIARGTTPLMLVANSGSVDTIRKMVDSGFKVYATDSGGRNAFVYASSHNASVDVAAFFSQFFDINEKTNGYTLLSYAIQANSPEIVEYLISKGADVHACGPGESYERLSPIQLAAQYRDVKMVDTLLAGGATVDEQCEKGVSGTALFNAGFNQAYGIDIAKDLVKHGAYVNAYWKDYGSLLYRVKMSSAPKAFIDFLVSQGAKEYGPTPSPVVTPMSPAPGNYSPAVAPYLGDYPMWHGPGYWPGWSKI